MSIKQNNVNKYAMVFRYNYLAKYGNYYETYLYDSCQYEHTLFGTKVTQKSITIR